jgi:hypothetical protein
VTKTRALEELQSTWVNQCLADGPNSSLLYPLVEMLPVWVSFCQFALSITFLTFA